MSWFDIYLIVCLGVFFVAPKRTKYTMYFRNVSVGIDQLLNAILFGDPDETISSRAYKGKLRGNKFWTLMCKVLDKLDTNHSEKSVEWDEGTGQRTDPLNTPRNE